MGRGKGAAKVSKRTTFSFIQITLSLHFNYLRFTWNLLFLNTGLTVVTMRFLFISFFNDNCLKQKFINLMLCIIFTYICIVFPWVCFFSLYYFMLLISGMCCGLPMSLCRETCFLTINTDSYATGKKERTENNSDGFKGKVRISRKRKRSRAA